MLAKLKFKKKMPKHLAYRAHLIYNSLTTLECVSPESREVSILYEQVNCPVLLSLVGGLPIIREQKKKSAFSIFWFLPCTSSKRKVVLLSFNLLSISFLVAHLLHPLPSPLYLSFSLSAPLLNRSSFVGS